MSTIKIQVAPRVGPANPRGAMIAAAFFVSLWQAVAGLGRKLQPAPPTPQQEAQKVRELATSYLRTEPSFAAELFAAADRHERLHMK
jgi:hypothetical protein